MRVRAPPMEADEDGSIRVQDLAQSIMSRWRLGLTEERLVPFTADPYVSDADDRPRAFHGGSAGGFRAVRQRRRLFSIGQLAAIAQWREGGLDRLDPRDRAGPPVRDR